MENQANLETLLREIESAAGDSDHDESTLSVADVQAHFGQRAFGPVLVIAALPVASPLVNLPGVASTMGVVICLVSLQMLLGRNSFWLPEWVRSRSVGLGRVRKAASFLQPVARQIDKVLRDRLRLLTRPPFLQIVALCCAIVGAAMPIVEVVPATSAIPAVPIIAFGLGIMAHDGVMIIAGFVLLVLLLMGGVLLWGFLLG